MKGLRRLAEYREDHPGLKKIAFMGGVSFKYTEWYTADPAESARMAEQLAPFVDVVTTSGAGTGSPPSAEKITAMGRAAGPGRLAVASGISIENIADYSDQPDMTVLVASSLETEKYSGIFIPERVRAVVEAAHAISQ
jgi:predicted TIM-barrel enzyme